MALRSPEYNIEKNDKNLFSLQYNKSSCRVTYIASSIAQGQRAATFPWVKFTRFGMGTSDADADADASWRPNCIFCVAKDDIYV